MSEWKKAAIEYKYAEIPEKPQYKKKKKKKKIKRSDHKHQYENCLYHISKFNKLNLGEYFIGTYCSICGRIDDISIKDISLDDNNLPIFEINSWFDKFVI